MADEPFVPKLGDLISYTHKSSGIYRKPGLIVSEDGDFFNVRVEGYSILFALHKKNQFGMAEPFEKAFAYA